MIFVALLIPVGAFHLWSGGSGAIGRPVIAAILLLGLPIAWLARRTASSAVAAASLTLLAAASVAQMLFLLCAQKGLLLVAGRDGVSRLLEYWSPSWRLWSLAPSFLMQPPAIAWAFTAIWLIALAAAAIAMARLRRPLAPGAAGLAACGVAGGAVLLVSLLVPAVLDRWRAPAPGPGVRAQMALLSDFDAQRRPLGVVYDPLRRVPSSAIPPLLAFVAGPRARGERTGVDLLYDARWSLPAGRYELCLDGRGRTIQGEIGLQVGRVGPPLRTWTIAPAARWTTTLDLPANARFVGFRASPELAGRGARAAADPARGRRSAHAQDRSGSPAEPPVRRRRGVLLRRARRRRSRPASGHAATARAASPWRSRPIGRRRCACAPGRPRRRCRPRSTATSSG